MARNPEYGPGDTRAQVRPESSDGERVEPARSSLHRLAPVALAALGIFGALLTIFAGLVALNHSVLPFNGWPGDGERLDAGRQVLPRAPVVTGRLRTAPGGVLAGASPVVHVAVPVVAVEPRTVSLVGLTVHRGTTHAAAPKSVPTPAQQPVAPPPQPAPAPAQAPTPVAASVPVPAATPVVISRRPVSRAPSTPTSSGPGGGHGRGRATAPGQLRKALALRAPVAAAAAPVPPAPAPPGQPSDGPGNSANAPGHADGHGPPPWAHGHH